MKLLPLNTAALTSFASIMYFSPWWWSGDPFDMLGFALSASFWFSVVWIIAFMHLGFVVKFVRLRDKRWRPHALSAAIIFACYFPLLSGMKEGYIIST
jgi:hypothetical protein